MKIKILIFALITCLVFGCSSQPAWDTKEGAYKKATEEISKQLKAPATARFSALSDSNSGCVFLGNHQWKSWGTVDAQNSFGALIRTDWEAIGDGTMAMYWRLGADDSGTASLNAAYDLAANKKAADAPSPAP